jgi:DNA-binding Lrp family transcriptional regulator
MFPIKFTSQSDIELFKALQKFGKLSHKKLAKKTRMPKTTVQYAYDRLQERKFYDIKALPRLDQFPELPIAFLSFTNLHPIKLRTLKNIYSKKEEVRVLIINAKDILIILMHSSKDRLTELIFEIMEKAQARPTLHILSPIIAKLDLTIPDKILDAIYPGLPDKKRK